MTSIGQAEGRFVGRSAARRQDERVRPYPKVTLDGMQVTDEQHPVLAPPFSEDELWRALRAGRP